MRRNVTPNYTLLPDEMTLNHKCHYSEIMKNMNHDRHSASTEYFTGFPGFTAGEGHVPKSLHWKGRNSLKLCSPRNAILSASKGLLKSWSSEFQTLNPAYGIFEQSDNKVNGFTGAKNSSCEYVFLKVPQSVKMWKILPMSSSPLLVIISILRKFFPINYLFKFVTEVCQLSILLGHRLLCL